jgi:hypothetical protein
MEQSEYIKAAFTRVGELAAEHVGKNEPHESTLARRCFVDHVPVGDCAELLCAVLTTHAYHEMNKARALLNTPVWCLWSFGHRAWWRPNRAGYTPLAEEAGRYGAEDVCGILAGSTPGYNIPIHERNANNTNWPAVTAR